MRFPKPVSRRQFVKLSGLTVGTASLTLATPGRAADKPAPNRDPDAVLAQLLEGNKRFAKGETADPRRKPNDFAPLAEGQAPLAVIVGCADSRVAPELPTVAELGFAGFEVIGWFGWLAPARMPNEIVARLNSDIVKVLRSTETQDRLITLGCEPVGNSSHEFAAFVSAERDKWAKVIKQAGIKLD